MILKNINKVYLGSKSPRRQELLKGMGISFELLLQDVDESFDAHLTKEAIPHYLCSIKAEAIKNKLKSNELLITADTIVWVNNHVLNKPENKEEAFKMINELQNNKHIVYTAVQLTSLEKTISFYEATEVEFNPLSPEEIIYYLDHFKPYDKAGAYGVQEWIGYNAIKSINGSYTNVVGLPTARLYEALKKHF